MPGAPLLALTRFHARARLSPASTACSNSWLVVASSCFKARCVPAAATSPPGGVVDAAEVFCVCSLCLCCSALQRPDSWPPTTASADFCPVTPARCRASRCGVDGGCCRFFVTRRAARCGAWFLLPRCEPSGFCHLQRPSLAVQISPGKNANCRCTSAAFTVGCVPVGFAVMCQLSSHPSALYAVSVRRPAPLALRLPPDKPSRARPCLRLVVILRSR